MKYHITISPEKIKRIKEKRIVRFLLLPYIRLRRQVNNKLYRQSIDSDNVSSFKDRHLNEACFIIGNGKSLTLEDLEIIENIKDVKTFASNRIYKLYDETKWRPNYYVAFEPEFVTQNIDKIVNVDADFVFLNMIGKKKCHNHPPKRVVWLNCTSSFCINRYTTKNISFSYDPANYIGDGYSVTFTALQLAVYMGFKTIYLIGMDHYVSKRSFSHFYESSKAEYNTDTYLEGIEFGYRKAKESAEKMGVKILNATRGGKLEVFQRIEFDDVIESLKRKL